MLPDVSKECSAEGALSCDTGQQALRLITMIVIRVIASITLRTAI
jgi:hypothetical protein